ncbi:MAG: restriction endonuclease [Deltaproteobacteria bacterium]|uniref:Restriction endonuclease n=1 Tax=Candidatus Zymogenus saltonus TaxID=2844893 RepID=A0A9D8PQ79_9DELT|nr:restriction endonuclease [Candidatus Zymogenus saltonus]
MDESLKSIEKDIEKAIKAYEVVVKGIDEKAQHSDDRAYGGIVRAGKGKLVEAIAGLMVSLAWETLGGSDERIFMDRRKVKIPIKKDYIEKIKNEETRQYIRDNIKRHYYGLSTDLHVHIDKKFVVAIECKAYTENAMLKRILVDFTLLKEAYPNIDLILIQLESQLGGDYSKLKDVTFGSPSTHTLISHFDITPTIITLLEGERKVDKPIHIPEFYKPLKKENLDKAVFTIREILRKHV